MEPEKWALARPYRVLKIRVKGIGFYAREMGEYLENFQTCHEYLHLRREWPAEGAAHDEGSGDDGEQWKNPGDTGGME